MSAGVHVALQQLRFLIIPQRSARRDLIDGNEGVVAQQHGRDAVRTAAHVVRAVLADRALELHQDLARVGDVIAVGIFELEQASLIVVRVGANGVERAPFEP